MFTREKHSLPNLRVHANGRITIVSAGPEHAGKYECAVVAGVQTTVAFAYLYVAVPPDIPQIQNVVSAPQTEGLREYQRLRLICTCNRGEPVPRLIWLMSSSTIFPSTTAAVAAFSVPGQFGEERQLETQVLVMCN
ncbi:hypothetical protein EG68_00128 [Paragonimus skrjabini miyazakii]|uniref:Ig-like domain-containing protein n=1 Tax=Paragonimus skrjabini miyazakii TaxID=59628 RepID=A0A8S9Z6T2_9TREM|nr:hypothetical protein EG68_00128 [Paragonimus skrjabini miyazakii]